MSRSTVSVRLSCAVILGIAGVCLPSLAQEPAPCNDVMLLAGDGAPDDSFGDTVALHGDVAIIGAPRDDNDNGVDAGAVYVYFNDPDQGWVEVQKLLASDGEAGDTFGRAGDNLGVALSAEFALIGASGDDNENGVDAGSVYVFRHDEEQGTWIEVQKILAPGGQTSDFFGTVAIDGDVAVIGAPQYNPNLDPGFAHAYRYDGSAWMWEQELPYTPSGQNDNFAAVAVAGDVIVVGAPGSQGFRGVFYVYRYEDGVWTQEQTVTETGSSVLGRHVAIVGDPPRIAVESSEGSGRGAVYVYCEGCAKDGPTWSLEQVLVASDGSSPDLFGWSLDLSSDPVWRIVVGANNDDHDGHQGGSAYEYRFVGDAWCCERKFRPPTDPNYSRFGMSIAVDGEKVLLGAPATGAGAAYVYDLALNCNCPADIDGTGDVGFADLLAVLSAWGPYEPCPPYVAEDVDQNCDVGFSDVLAILSAWGPCQ